MNPSQLVIRPRITTLVIGVNTLVGRIGPVGRIGLIGRIKSRQLLTQRLKPHCHLLRTLSKAVNLSLLIHHPPKAVPEVSGPEVPVSSLPEAPSSSGVLISEARPLELRPRGGPQVASTASSVAGAHPTIRLSLDLHGVLDLGSTGKGRWSTVAIDQLANWLSQSPYHQAGVYSYIGLKGAESKFRRDQALASVRRFNTAHNADLRIGITTDKPKSDIKAQEVSVHVDDKVEICRQLNDRGVPNICLNPNLRNPPPDLVVVKDIVAAFEAIERLRLVPRVWASQWPGIFKTG